MIYEKITRQPSDFKDECLNSAGFIYDSTSLPINVLMSGGLDSVVVAECFRIQDIPFTVYTFRLKDGKNDFDIEYALDYCNYHGIKHNVIEIDYKKFWENELIFYCLNGQFTSPQYAIHCWLMDQADGLVIMGNGWLNLTYRDMAPKIFEEEDFAWNYDQRWLDFRNREGAPKFFEYTSEQKIASVWNDIVKTWITLSPNLWDRHDKTKETMYKKMFPNLKLRRYIDAKSIVNKGRLYKSKSYHGFEEVWSEDVHYRNKMKDLLDIPTDNKLIPYPEMIDILIPEDRMKGLKQKIMADFDRSISRMSDFDFKKILPKD